MSRKAMIWLAVAIVFGSMAIAMIPKNETDRPAPANRDTQVPSEPAPAR
jgi:hypothetical protein